MALLVGVGALLGVSVLPAVVGIVVSTWVVCVGPSTVQVYTHVEHHTTVKYSVQTVPVLTSFIHCPSGVRHFTAGC